METVAWTLWSRGTVRTDARFLSLVCTNFQRTFMNRKSVLFLERCLPVLFLALSQQEGIGSRRRVLQRFVFVFVHFTSEKLQYRLFLQAVSSALALLAGWCSSSSSVVVVVVVAAGARRPRSERSYTTASKTTVFSVRSRNKRR